MDPLGARFPPSKPRAKHLVGRRLTVVFFGVHADIIKACEPLARALPFARAEAKHLHAACAAVVALRDTMLVVPATLRPSDCEVIEEHVSDMDVPVLWVSADHAPEDAVASIESWATAALRFR